MRCLQPYIIPDYIAEQFIPAHSLVAVLQKDPKIWFHDGTMGV